VSYLTISVCAADQTFQGRVRACAAQEGEAQPDLIIGQLIWPVSSASDIEAAYASALAADNPDPGGDPAVITDQMILSAVQSNWPTSP
jgi:hypothetical protein